MCIYAVSYLRDHAFVTTKCNVTDQILNLLKIMKFIIYLFILFNINKLFYVKKSMNLK